MAAGGVSIGALLDRAQQFYQQRVNDIQDRLNQIQAAEDGSCPA